MVVRVALPCLMSVRQWLAWLGLNARLGLGLGLRLGLGFELGLGFRLEGPAVARRVHGLRGAVLDIHAHQGVAHDLELLAGGRLG